jgi:hypothetical protein
MQLGFVTAIFGDLTFEQVLKYAAEIGYDCVEVMCWPPGVRDRKYGGVTHIDWHRVHADAGGRHPGALRQAWRQDFSAGLLPQRPLAR